MADITEVGQALVAIVGQAAIGASSSPIEVQQGWPIVQQLSAGLLAGRVHISVFPRPGDKVIWVGSGPWQTGTTNADGSVNMFQEIRRQKRDFQITIWASCFDRRDPVAKAVDTALAGISNLSFPDGSSGILRYTNSIQDDDSQKQGIYRRDLFYSVEYSIVATSLAWPISAITVNLNVSAPQPTPPAPVPVAAVTFNITNS